MSENQKACKSCGMPLVKGEDFGTNADGSKSEEYCVYCMKDGHAVQFCQSCGMPLAKDEDFGTEADGSKSEEYCSWCYKDGKFTNDLTMEEMMEECTKFDWSNGGDDISKEEKIAVMKDMYPQLKRWKKA